MSYLPRERPPPPVQPGVPLCAASPPLPPWGTIGEGGGEGGTYYAIIMVVIITIVVIITDG